VYFGRKRYILYAFFSFCRFPVYFPRLQRSLCHQPWDLRPRGCLVGSEGRGEVVQLVKREQVIEKGKKRPILRVPILSYLPKEIRQSKPVWLMLL
uniref:Uncharacterized protein n=1 Tax=Suricata suricatta TaxID=37032 RepID=A0A673URU4_SURSU